MMITDHRDLTKLASQLHSEYDRNHYTKVISMAEQLQSKIQALKKIKTSKTSLNLQGATTTNHHHHDIASSTSLNKQQPLDRYYRLLERSQSIQKQLSRISTEYALPQPPPLPPQHPPPSFPPPSVPTPPPKTPQKTTLDIRLPSTPPPTPKKANNNNHHPIKNDDPLITPPASPRMKQVRFQDYHSIERRVDDQHRPKDLPLPPVPPTRALPPITHVQKKINGLRGFLTRTYQLSDSLVMSRTHITPLRLFTATEILTGKPKAVLKVVITSHHDHGFSFYWPSSPTSPSSITTTIPIPSANNNNHNNNNNMMMKPNRSQDIAKFSLVSDALVQDALDSWIQQQGGVLPPLFQATHILRESIKIYVVYNRYHFNL